MSGVREQRAAACAGERVRLRQRAQHDQIREAIERSLIRLVDVGELDVGLVDDHDQRVVAQLRAQQSRWRARSSRLPVGLFGVQRKTSLTPSRHAASTACASSAKPRSLSSGTSIDARALDARRDLVHAECRRTDQHAVLPGATERAHQQVDAFVAAAAGEHVLRRDAVQLREMLRSARAAAARDSDSGRRSEASPSARHGISLACMRSSDGSHAAC